MTASGGLRLTNPYVLLVGLSGYTMCRTQTVEKQSDKSPSLRQQTANKFWKNGMLSAKARRVLRSKRSHSVQCRSPSTPGERNEQFVRRVMFRENQFLMKNISGSR